MNKKELYNRINELEHCVAVKDYQLETEAKTMLSLHRNNDILMTQNIELEKYINQLEQREGELFNNLLKAKHCYEITRIVHNKEKGTTVIWFSDGTKKIVKRKAGVRDCVYTAVAFAIVEKMFGSNSAFQDMVERMVK